MRWEMLKRAWLLAKASYPGKKVWVSAPYRFGAAGSMSVFDLDDIGAPIGEIKYATAVSHGKSSVRLQAAGGGDSFYMPAAPRRSFRIAAKSAPPSALLAARYAADEMPSKAALLYAASGLPLTRAGVEGWLAASSFGTDPAAVCDSLRDMGFPVRVAAGPAAPKPKFKEGQKVRVEDRSSMEYKELATVLEVLGDRGDGFWYKILVDGSSRPIMAPQDSLAENRAGEIPQ